MTTTNVTIFATDGSDGIGRNTGIAFQTGDTFSVSASGSWSYGGLCGIVTPDGCDEPTYYTTTLVFGHRVGDLVGRIGTSGSWFAVNSRFTGTASTSGSLYLALNDQAGAYGDNSGNIAVSINAGGPGEPFNTGKNQCTVLSWAGKPTKGDPVDILHGEVTETGTDMSLVTPIAALTFTRIYRQNKQQTYQFMGLGWTHNHAASLTANTSTETLVIQMPDGGELRLTETGYQTNQYIADPGSVATADWNITNANSYTLVAGDKSAYVFNSSGQLISRTWLNHETWTYSYSAGKLQSVTDTYGKGLQFVYISNPGQFNDGQLWRVGDNPTSSDLSSSNPTERYIEFSYSQSGTSALLTGVRDVRGNKWVYQYNAANYLVQRLSPPVDVTGAGGSGIPISLEALNYTLNGSTVSQLNQSRGNSLEQTTFIFQAGGQNITTETTAGRTTVHHFNNGVYAGPQDPAGNFNAQAVNYQYRPNSQTDANGHSTQLAWSGDGGVLNQVTDALGNQTAFTYNSGGLSDRTLASSIDAQGRRTVYTYTDSSNPRLPTRVQVYDTDGKTVLRWQQFSYDSAGRTLTERTYDPTSNGTVLVSEVDRSYYTSGNGAGLLQKLVQQDLVNPANTVTTTYFYDSAGRVNRVNQSATFGSCTSSFTLYDPAGNVLASVCNYDNGGSADPTTLASLLAFYNPAYPDKNRTTTYTYDALNRRVSTTTDAGAPYALTTLTVYDALNRVVRSIANYVPNQAIPDPYVHNRADFSHGPNNDQNLMTDTAYNERGLVRSQTDVLGNVTLFGYDLADRLVKTVQFTSQPGYDNSYTTGDPSLANYVTSSAPDQDLITSSLYDPVGNLVATTDALGNVSFTFYDALNRPVKTVRSASAPTYNILADPSLGAYAFSSAPDQDLVETTTYDSLGHIVQSVDALGNTTLFGYDGLGRQVKTIRFASQPGYNMTADPTLTNYALSTAPDQDLVSTTVYDSFGRVMTTADTLGRATWTAYDGLNRAIRSVVNATGTATDGTAHDPRSPSYSAVTSSDQDLIASTVYDTNGYVLYTADVLGRRNWTGYDSVGRPIRSVANAVGSALDGGPTDPRSTIYVPNSDADKDLVTGSVYNAQGRVAATFDALGNQTTYTYDALGRRIQTIANYMTGTFHASQPDRDLLSTTTYDVAGRVVLTVDPRGTQTVFAYDRAGRRLSVTTAANTALATTSYTCYDKGGRVLRIIQNYKPGPFDPLPDARDASGNFLFNPTWHGAANDSNLITVYTLDRLGRQTAVSNPLGNTASTAYYRDGQVESAIDPLGVITRFRYDRARRRSLVVQNYTAASDPATWSWSTANSRWQDGSGNAIAFGTNHDQNIVVQSTLDKAGRVLAVRDPLGHLTSYTYDLLNRRTSATDPLGHLWSSLFVNQNRVLQTTSTDPLGNATRRSADQVGRVKLIQYLNESPKNTPDVTLSYDKAGNRLGMVETGGSGTVRKASYVYDQARRLNSVSSDVTGNGSNVQTVSYAYDAVGNRTALTLPGSLTVSYSYDARGQLVGLTDWASQKTTYTYDLAGRPAGVFRSNGLRSSYAFDAAGRLTQLRHASAGGQVRGHFTYSVDAHGNRTQAYEAVPHTSTGSTTLAYNDPSIVFYQGVWSASAPFMVSTSFSAGLRLVFFGTGATSLKMGVGPDHSIYDVYVDGDLWQSVDGYAASASDTTLTITTAGDGPHLLDIRNRPEKNLQSTGYKIRFESLTTASSAYQYDLQTTTYTYDGLARLLTANMYPGLNTGTTPSRAYTYAFDVAGNRTQQVVNTGSPVTTNYTYNAANQLVSDGTHSYTYDAAGRMTSDGVNAYGWDRANRLLSYNTTAYQYTYDGDGRRVQQTVAGTVTQYLLDIQPTLERVWAATTGASTNYYVHDQQGVLEQQIAGAWNGIVRDGLNNVRGVFDANLNPLESQLFDPFGSVITNTGGNQTNFGFAGEWTDGTGLVNDRTRYYNPALGIFPSLDPLEGTMGQPMSLNRYMYVQGNVPNMVDPSGMIDERPESWASCGGSLPQQAGDPCHCKFGDFFQYLQCQQGNRNYQCQQATATPFPIPLVITPVPTCRVLLEPEGDYVGGAAFRAVKWDYAVPNLDKFKSKYNQVLDAENKTRSCSAIDLVGYSRGADSAIIFASRNAGKIRGLALLGPTLTGCTGPLDTSDPNNQNPPCTTTTIDAGEANNQAVWQTTLTGLVNSKRYVYVLNDKQNAAIKKQGGHDIDALFKGLAVYSSPYFHYELHEDVTHWSPESPSDPNHEDKSTNNDLKWVTDALNFISKW